MLNEKTGLRELAYIVKIDGILPIQGSDNCECAVVGGWHVMVRKGTFHTGDAAVYFEIDSKVDITKPQFSFLAKYDGKVKSQKYTFGGKGNFLSQGLIMPLSDFGWTVENHPIKTFVTKELDVTYYDPEDNIRKNGKSKENKYVKYNNDEFIPCSKSEYKLDKISYDKVKSMYSYKYKNNKLYKVIKDNKKIESVINFNDVSIVGEYKNILYYVYEDNLYKYSSSIGNKKVFYSFELNFNKDNTIFIYNK